jgi:hypothetical protein
MPVALILQLFAVAQGVAAGAPAAIEAFNRVKDLIAGKGEKVTVDELVNALAGATDAHEDLQAALRPAGENRSPVALENTSPAVGNAVVGARTTATASVPSKSPIDDLLNKQ